MHLRLGEGSGWMGVTKTKFISGRRRMAAPTSTSEPEPKRLDGSFEMPIFVMTIVTVGLWLASLGTLLLSVFWSNGTRPAPVRIDPTKTGRQRR